MKKRMFSLVVSVCMVLTLILGTTAQVNGKGQSVSPLRCDEPSVLVSQ